MAAGCLYTRIRHAWKTINRGDVEQHLIKEGLPFTKEAVDAAHARYVKELQEADKKAKADEEAQRKAEEARRAAESGSESASNITKPKGGGKRARQTAHTTSNSGSGRSKERVWERVRSNNSAYRPKIKHKSGCTV